MPALSPVILNKHKFSKSEVWMHTEKAAVLCHCHAKLIQQKLHKACRINLFSRNISWYSMMDIYIYMYIYLLDSVFHECHLAGRCRQ
jgi:hypothetical protein